MVFLVDEVAALLVAEVGDGHVHTLTSASPSTCVIARGDRRVRVMKVTHGLLLHFFDRVEMSHGHTEESGAAVRACVCWLDGSNLQQLRVEYPFVRFSELQLAYEQGTALETQWQILLRNGPGSLYGELIELASRDPFLGKLFPYAGHRFVLHEDEFSSGELVGVFFVTDGRYRIYRRGPVASTAENAEGDVVAEIEFEGGASAIVEYLSERLRSRQSGS
jgi:hypothetical protein